MLEVIPNVNECIDLKENIAFSNYQIFIKNKFINAVDEFNDLLSSKLIVDESKIQYTFEFELDKALKAEEYHIYMNDKNTYVQAGGEQAFYYACKTLISILNLKKIKQVKEIKAKAYEIIDSPMFSYRSFMIDIASSYIELEDIYKLIDKLSDLKMNTLHLLLSYDDKCRISFRSIPSLLTEEKYYHYHDMKDIISYCKKKYIEVVPEIDLLSHNHSLLNNNMFLKCDNKDTLCISNPMTLEFYKKIISEVAILFKDSKYIHIGGNDSINYYSINCPYCKAIKDIEEYQNKKTIFINSLIEYISSLKKQAIVFNESINKNTNRNAIMHYYSNSLSSKEIKDVYKGRKTICSSFTNLLFDEAIPLEYAYSLSFSDLNLLSNIIGMEGCLYTNNKYDITSTSFDNRLKALASNCYVHIEKKDFDSFKKILKIK